MFKNNPFPRPKFDAVDAAIEEATLEIQQGVDKMMGHEYQRATAPQGSLGAVAAEPTEHVLSTMSGMRESFQHRKQELEEKISMLQEQLRNTNMALAALDDGLNRLEKEVHGPNAGKPAPNAR